MTRTPSRYAYHWVSDPMKQWELDTYAIGMLFVRVGVVCPTSIPHRNCFDYADHRYLFLRQSKDVNVLQWFTSSFAWGRAFLDFLKKFSKVLEGFCIFSGFAVFFTPRVLFMRTPLFFLLIGLLIATISPICLWDIGSISPFAMSYAIFSSNGLPKKTKLG